MERDRSTSAISGRDQVIRPEMVERRGDEVGRGERGEGG